MRLLILIIILLSVPCIAYTDIDYSTDNLSWINYTQTNDNYVIIEELDDGIDENSVYYFRLRHVYDNYTSQWFYISSRTNTSGEVSMSSLAVVGFFTLLSFTLLFLPMFIRRMSDAPILDYVLKRLSIICGLFLLSLAITVTVTIADTFSLGVNDLLFTVLYICNWVIYLSMGALVLLFGKKVLEMWNDQKYQRRFGDTNEI